MKRTIRTLVLWLLVGIAGAGAPRAQDFLLFSHDQLEDVRVNGVNITQPGSYTVWAWSLDRSPLTLVAGESTFESAPNPKAAEEAYSWKKLGVLEVKETQVLPLQMYSDPRGRILQPRAVGWLALTQDPGCDFNDLFGMARVFPDSAQAVQDARRGVVRSIEKYYEFPRYESMRAWLERKRELEIHILTSMGAYPMPDKTPLNAKRFGKIERDDYTVEKVYFESLPGFFATGNLYSPKGKPGPYPAILCPHGHWQEGRLVNTDNNSIPGRCINFAKQGYVTLAIDMIGYVDSKQLTHKFGGEREWLWGLSLHGLQFWNTIRAVDFLLSLDNVDPERIACTGASGGGTQTYCLVAADDRVKFAAPVNMISAHYQGGCLCENAPNLRIGANNVEYGAMIAPRPLIMVSTNQDWTDETPRVEFPAIQSIYRLFDAPDRVTWTMINAEHNYNQASREAVYAWFGKWMLGGNDPAKFKEQPFTVEKEEDLRVFPGSLPENAVSQEQLVKNWIAQSEAQFQSVFPANNRLLQALRRRARATFEHVLGARQPEINDLVVNRAGRVQKPDMYIEHLVIGRRGVGDQIPCTVLIPASLRGAAPAALLVHGEGKLGWFGAGGGRADGLVRALLEQGQIVMLADVFLTGEHDTPFEKAGRSTDASQFLTYNQTDTALRVQDILTASAYLGSRFDVTGVTLAGGGEAGLWCLLAAPLASSLQGVIVDAAGFNSGDDQEFLRRLFVPGLRRAGDLRAAQAALAPVPLVIHNTLGKLDTDWAAQAYQTAGVSDLFESLEQPVSAEYIVQWMRDLRIR